MDQHPLISIIIPTYQHAGDIAQCLESIFHQTYTRYEVIVVDDDSSDNTIEVLAPYGDRITLITQPKRNGSTENRGNAARNRGFTASKGEYVLFCDADVIMRKDFLEKSLIALQQHPESSYAYCSYRFGWKKFHAWPFDPSLLRRMNYIHTTSLIRRNDFPGFDESIKKFQDWDLWLTMLAQGKTGVCMDEMLFRAIPHTKGISVWVPGFLYRIPWERLGIRVGSIDRYNSAAAIIRAKHRLDAGPSEESTVLSLESDYTPKKFFSFFGMSIALYILFEALSLAGYLYPVVANIVFAALCGVAAVLTVIRLDIAVLLVLGELFIGSQGGAMISLGAEQGQDGISLRLGLFLTVWSVWLATRLTLLLSRNVPKRQSGWLWFEQMRVSRLFVPYCALLLIILSGICIGILRGYSFSTVFFDANGYAYLALLPVCISGLTRKNTWKQLVAILAAAVTIATIKALVVLYIFSHRLLWLAKIIYAWVRDTRVGEITITLGDFYRVFFQSQIFAVVVLCFSVSYLLFGNKDSVDVLLKTKLQKKSLFVWIMLCISSSSVILGLSRSNWFGIVVVMGMLCLTLLFSSAGRKRVPRLLGMGVVGGVVGFVMIFGFYTFPFPQKKGSVSLASLLSDRALSSDDAAAKSRWALLPKLVEAGREHPLIGSGLGRTVTYQTSDPRLLSALQKADYTTYAFEWGYLDLWVKFGLVGILVYAWFVIVLLKPFWGAVRSLVAKVPHDPEFLSLGVFLSVSALLAIHTFSPYLNHPLGIGILVLAGALSCTGVLLHAKKDVV